MEIDYKDLGERVKFYRKKAGLQQNQLAEAANQEPSYISHIERGVSKIGLTALVSIANELGITTDDLLCGSLTNASHIHQQNIDHILADCTLTERKFLLAALHDLKKRLREAESHCKP